MYVQIICLVACTLSVSVKNSSWMVLELNLDHKPLKKISAVVLYWNLDGKNVSFLLMVALTESAEQSIDQVF
jgi:hypothetical protein